MKYILLSTCFFSCLFSVLGQNDRSKKVKTKYLSLPSYNVSTTNLSSLNAEFSIEMATFGTETQKEAVATCIPKDGTIKDVIEVKSFYYEVPVVWPNSYMVVKDAGGKILYAEKTSGEQKGVVKFGYQKCNYWLPDNLKKDWEKEQPIFKGKVEKENEQKTFQIAQKYTNKNIKLAYIKQEFEVYSAKGKTFDYSELDQALNKALSAYETIEKVGPSEASFKTLKECVAIWEKELEVLDLEDKKARISKDIAKGLHENCAIAYMFMYDFDKAIAHGKKYVPLWGNYSSTRSREFEALMREIEIQKIAAENNQNLLSDFSMLAQKEKEASSASVGYTKVSGADFERLKQEHQRYLSERYSGVVEMRNEEEASAIARGDVNAYQKFVVMTPPMGPFIQMSMAPFEGVNDFPALTELPIEMCELDLKQLMIRMNSIASIPAQIGNMKNLEKLDLTGNKLTTLPPEIGQLKELKNLKLGKNPIESLPPEIANCKKLKSLDLKGTQLSDVAKADLAKWLPDCKIKY